MRIDSWYVCRIVCDDRWLEFEIRSHFSIIFAATADKQSSAGSCSSSFFFPPTLTNSVLYNLHESADYSGLIKTFGIRSK